MLQKVPTGWEIKPLIVEGNTEGMKHLVTSNIYLVKVSNWDPLGENEWLLKNKMHFFEWLCNS